MSIYKGDDDNETINGSTQNDEIYGYGGNDVLFGDKGNDYIAGGAGRDVLIGGEGDDRMVGGTGADYHWGDTGQDTASYTTSLAGVTVNLGVGPVGYGIGADAQGDTFYSVEQLEGSAHADYLIGDHAGNTFWGNAGADHLSGMAGNDQLLGGQGKDEVAGGAGFDVLTGGAGSDFLIGGTERDWFTFNSASETGMGKNHRDTIMDFGAGTVRDRIDLSGIDATSAPGDQAFTLVNGAFTDVAQVAVSYKNGNTYVRGNTNADLAADFEIELIGTHQLTTLDFIL